MKHLPLLLTTLLFTFPSFNAIADQSATVHLTLPAYWERETCPNPLWKGQSAIWKGVSDKRSSQAVGSQEKKEEVIEVIASPSLSDTFNNALKEMFLACGMKLLSDGPAEMMTLSVEIDDFYAGVEKKFLTGKSKASSRITLLALIGNASTKTIDVGFDMESKRIKRKDIRQLQDTLNQLLAETVKQLFQTSQIRELTL